MNPLKCQGFSLIEVMVSVMILLITIAGFMTTYSYFSRQVTKTQQKRSAVRFAQKTLEEFMGDPDFLQNYLPPNDTITHKITIDEQRNFEVRLEIKFSPLERIPVSKCQQIECEIFLVDSNISLATLATIWGI